MSTLKPVLYKEGMLFKRQRGLHTSNTKKLKFQERFCSLTSTSLDYYDPLPKKRADGPKGQFAVDKMKIVEPMSQNIFGKDFPFAIQIGDQSEIMYFVTDSETTRDDWLYAFRHAAKDSNVQMVSYHHHGVYGLINKGRWSCCANPRRDFVGCSPSFGSPAPKKDLTMTLPHHTSTPSSSHNSSGTSSLPRNVEPPKSAPARATTTTSTTFEPPPMIRRFTLLDPKMKPNTKRLNELRQSVDFDSMIEKEGELQEFEKDPLLPMIISDKDRDVGGSTLTKIISDKDRDDGGSTLTANYTKKKKEDTRSVGDGKVVNGGGVRSGASSPSPSVDSGRGTSAGSSRPSSQIESSDNTKIPRSGSVGKKPSQSVIQEQVFPSEEVPTNKLVKQPPVEDSDDSSQTVTPTEQGTPVREKENGIMSDSKTKEEIAKTQKDKESEGSKEPNDETDGFKRRSSARVASYDSNALHITPDNSSLGSRDRPVSMGSFNDEIVGNKRGSMYGSGSDVSVSDTPQQRKLRDRMTASPRIGDRPRSFVVKSMYQSLNVQGQAFVSQLHQSCKDGNLQQLDQALGGTYQCSELVNIEEPSYCDEIPYTPLFIAFINDHLQIMIKLLEYGANPNNIEPVHKASVLHWACAKGCLDIVDLLVKYKADVNKKDSLGNTPLLFACKNGHLDVVEFLLQHGASVDEKSANCRTSLHECSEEGHIDITELLLKVGRANPNPRDSNELTPYDIAYRKKHIELMFLLQQVTPEVVRPYSPLHLHTSFRAQMVTSLSFKGNEILVSGSRDCHVHFWDTSDLSEVDSIHLPNTVLSMDIYDHTHLVVGSTSIQIIDMDNLEKRRTVADDSNEDESLEDPPLHLVKFGPKGRLATASAENNRVRLWPSAVTQSMGIVTMPEALFVIGEDIQGHGCVYSLSMSPSPNCPWLAVGFQPGRMFSPRGNKLVYIYNWETKQLEQIFDAGEGGLEIGVNTVFSPCGRYLAIGCYKNLCIWDPKGGDLIQKFTVEKDITISSVCYSPNGTHLAAGLSSGEVQVFETSSSSPIFFLPRSKKSPVTAMVYSENGKYFATGHKNGCIQLWEAYGTMVSNSSSDR